MAKLNTALVGEYKLLSTGIFADYNSAWEFRLYLSKFGRLFSYVTLYDILRYQNNPKGALNFMKKQAYVLL